jgi:hypothetical protein
VGWHSSSPQRRWRMPLRTNPFGRCGSRGQAAPCHHHRRSQRLRASGRCVANNNGNIDLLVQACAATQIATKRRAFHENLYKHDVV